MPETLPVLVPQMNPNDEHAVLVSWQVATGTRVAAEQAVATLETTKATFDVNAPRAGYIHFDLPPRTMVPVGGAIAWVSDQAQPPALATAATAEPAAARTGGDERFTRKALRLMSQHGLTTQDFPGLARVETQDVERVLQARSAKPAAPQDVEEWSQTPSKMIEVARLSAVYREAVPSSVVITVATSLLNERLTQLAALHGPLSVLELTIHELMRLLPDYPDLNGYFADGRAWRYRHAVVGFAVNLGRGLKVPVVAASTTVLDVARSVRDLSLRYMRDELTMRDVVGGTFTVTDLSDRGVVHFLPVLNERQGAILGICAERPGSGYRELVLTFDHRLSDGMRAAAFLAELRDALEGQTP